MWTTYSVFWEDHSKAQIPNLHFFSISHIYPGTCVSNIFLNTWLNHPMIVDWWFEYGLTSMNPCKDCIRLQWLIIHCVAQPMIGLTLVCSNMLWDCKSGFRMQFYPILILVISQNIWNILLKFIQRWPDSTVWRNDANVMFAPDYSKPINYNLTLQAWHWNF